MLQKTSPQPIAANAPTVAPAPEAAAPPRPPREYAKFLVPLVVIGAVCVLVGISTQSFDQWTAGADVQTTDNAYIRADLSHLSARRWQCRVDQGQRLRSCEEGRHYPPDRSFRL
ncbi:hypothetical protein [Shinella sumterensis]|uniref:hypothetical protein n=1 Tax=Shinella sumterensis TaxID=1967501 RepID=UPI001E5119DB|nr:hypothetical protein [Shinella sumterensis]